MVLVLRLVWIGLLLFLTIRGIHIVRAWLLVSKLCMPAPVFPGHDHSRVTARSSDAPTLGSQL